jgi:hypothetical protein
MEKQKSAPPDYELLEHLRWHTEFLDRSHNQVIQRSSSLLGFVGVEIAVLAGFEAETRPEINLASMIALAITALLLLAAIWPREMNFPNVITNVSAYESSVIVRNENLAQQLLRPSEIEKSPIGTLEKLISSRGLCLKFAFIMLGVAQCLLTASIIAQIR